MSYPTWLHPCGPPHTWGVYPVPTTSRWITIKLDRVTITLCYLALWSVFILGWNPDFGRLVDINSYHSEIYASLASIGFLACYCELIFFALKSELATFYGNESYVTKISKLTNNSYQSLCIYKLKEDEDYLVLLSIIPLYLKIIHVHGHQDEKKEQSELSTAETLNI